MAQHVSDAYAALADRYIAISSIDQAHPDDVAFICARTRHLTAPIVDAGCGPGHFTGLLDSLGLDASGIDLVPEFIAHARSTHPTVRFRTGSMLSLPVTDDSLGGILAWYSLIHLDPAQIPFALAEFHRALQSGGLLLLGFFDGPAVEPFDHKVTRAYFWPLDEMSRRVTEAGFTVSETVARTTKDQRLHAALAAHKIG